MAAAERLKERNNGRRISAPVGVCAPPPLYSAPGAACNPPLMSLLLRSNLKLDLIALTGAHLFGKKQSTPVMKRHARHVIGWIVDLRRDARRHVVRRRQQQQKKPRNHNTL